VINKSLLIEQLKRFWVVSAFSVLALVLVVLLPLHGAFNEVQRARVLIEILSLRNPVMLFIIVATSLFSAFFTMGFFFSKKASTAFYTFPLNKNQLLLTNALAGLIISLIPIFVIVIFLLFPIPYEGWTAVNIETWIEGGVTRSFHSVTLNLPSSIFTRDLVVGNAVNSLPIMIMFLFRLVVISIFNFALCWLAFSVAGQGVIAILIAGAFSVIPMGFVVLIMGVGVNYVFGFASWMVEEFLLKIILGSNPALWGMWFNNFSGEVSLNTPLIAYLLLTILLLVSAFFVSRLRNPEFTGNSVVFKPVKYVLIFLVSLFSMIMFGFIMWSVTDSNPFMLHLGFVIGFVLGYLVAQMIAEKSFQIAEKIKYVLHFGSIALVLYLVMFFVTQVGLNFYTSFVPDENQVAGVMVTNNQNRWHLMMPEEQIENFFVRDQEIISSVINAHETIVNNRRNVHHAPWRQTVPDDYWLERYGSNFENTNLFLHMYTISYLMEDGGIINREYRLPSSFMLYSGLLDLIKTPQMIIANNFLPGFRDYIISIRIDYVYEPDLVDFDDWWLLNERHVLIFEPYQIDEMFETSKDALVNQTLTDLEWIDPSVSNVEQIPLPRVRIWLQFDWDNAPIYIRATRIGSAIFAMGENAQPVIDLLLEWGLIE